MAPVLVEIWLVCADVNYFFHTTLKLSRVFIQYPDTV